MMGQEILSLKSIYKILTANDYPVYSDKVISKEHHKGLSLYGFWQSILIPEWKETPTGSKIWRNEGGRNRYTSEICNRSVHNHYYKGYLEEIASSFSKELLFKQVFQFMNMLYERDYNYKAFIHRVKASIRLYEKEDAAFDKKSDAFFHDILQQELFFEELGSFGKLFLCSYLLTMLTIHGLGGNGEGEEALDRIRNHSGCEIKTAYFYACKQEVVNRHWTVVAKRNPDLHRTEIESQTREYIEYLMNCYNQLQDIQKVKILQNTLIQLFGEERAES